MGAHWTGIIVIGILVLVLFGGRGKISALMGDMAKGITAFRKGLKDEDETEASDEAPKSIDSQASEPVATAREDERSGS